MKNQNELQGEVWKSMKAHPIFRGCGLSVLLVLCSLVLGIAFFLIIYGLWLGFQWIGPYWAPTYRIIKRIDAPINTQTDLEHLPITWWIIIPLIIKATLVGAMVYLGVYVLITKGFLNQNFIWLLLRN